MNAYKPRYKIAFQAKSKIWPYKDSRLRRFFTIRGRKLVRRGLFRRNVVVLNNMKWTIARRYIRPYMRRRRAVRRRYRNIFYTKQQLRAFHGKMKEENFRNFFKTHLAQGINRNKSFYASLERRLDIFFFRLRILPTIFACHQYIIHQGVLINNGRITSPGSLVRPGDILSICPEHWPVLYDYMRERILYRAHGKYLMVRRRYKRMRKKLWFLRYFMRGKTLMYTIWYKRKMLNFFIQERKKRLVSYYKKLFKSWNTIINAYNDLLGFDKAKKYHSRWFQMFNRLATLSKTINTFLELEKKRQNFFSYQWKYFKRTWTFQRKIKIKKKFSFISKKLKTPSVLKVLMMKQKIKALIHAKEWNQLKKYIHEYNKKYVNVEEINSTSKEKRQELEKIWKTSNINNSTLYSNKPKKYKNYYLRFIYMLKMISTTYLRWLNFITQLRMFELKFYYDLFSPLKGDATQVEIRDMFQEHLTQTFFASRHIQRSVLLYYRLFFRKFFKAERTKVFKNWVAFPLHEKSIERIYLYVPTGTALVSWLMRRRFRRRRRKAVVRLKPVHWGMPQYIHFDVATLRGMFLYAPQAKEIYYPFKCTLPKIVSFYKSLGL